MSQNIGFKLPSSWLQVGLSDLFLDPKNNIVDGPFGSNLKASEYREEGIPVIRIQNIDRNRFIDKNINYVTEEKAKFLLRHSFISGDIIITKLGTPVGKACFVPAKYENGILVADLIRVRIDNDYINEKFLLYQINSSFLIKQFERFTKGTTRPRINLSIVRELKFNLPPLKEQERIVAVIEELFSDLDNGVANLKLAQKQLKVYRQALLKHAFEGKLTENWRKVNKPESAKKLLDHIKEERKRRYEKELNDWKNAVILWEKAGKKEKRPSRISRLKVYSEVAFEAINSYGNLPNNWQWTKLGEVSYKVGDIDHKMPKDFPDGIPYLSTGNILGDGTLDFSKSKTISEKDYIQLSRKIKPEKHDIIFPRYGTIGRNVLVKTDSKFLVSYSCAIIKTIPSLINEKYLYYFTLSPVIQKEITKYIVQTTQANIGISSIENFVFPICSKLEQNQIVQELENILSMIDNLEQVINYSLLRSDVLRHSILKKAFEGKLVEQDSNEEPANELLKKIKFEKAEYLKNQRQENKIAPQKIKKMNQELSIEEVLKTSNEPMLSADVWLQSKHKDNIEDFYTELKKIQSTVKELKKGNESLLTLEK
ncbi:hypothetical protein SDC9_44160 [bioreactor metagenome]|uniref:Type I restriction modification DNA specificity domain-containing protein n=1 Tax=bioreactor metagenome TaxID=1076179 RepID=A0A644W6B0_9ZZZZ